MIQDTLNKISQLFGLDSTAGETDGPDSYLSTRAKLKQVFQERSQRRRLAKAKFTPKVTSRRTVSLFPAPISGLQKELMQTQEINFHKLLIQIEGNQCSGCLQITSQKNRSRSAILVYRGRAIGCAWGQRQQNHQYFGQDALNHALSDLAAPDNQLLGYQLPEDIVLAAASLFHGQALAFDLSQGAKENTQNAILSIRSSEYPGTVVVNGGDNQDVFMVYVNKGKVLGLHSIEKGWMDESQSSAFFDSLDSANAHVSSSIFVVRTSQEAYKMALSLTGIGEKDRQNELTKEKVESLRQVGSRKAPGPRRIMKLGTRKDGRAQPKLEHIPVPTSYTGFHCGSTSLQVCHAHKINP